MNSKLSGGPLPKFRSSGPECCKLFLFSLSAELTWGLPGDSLLIRAGLSTSEREFFVDSEQTISAPEIIPVQHIAVPQIISTFRVVIFSPSIC
jgi:hypothetical protein